MGTLDYCGPAAEMWRSTQCPECGYCLTGLPEAGRCPECGYEYSPQEVILWGWAGRHKANVANSHGWRLTRLFGSLILLPAFLGCIYSIGLLDRVTMGIVLLFAGADVYLFVRRYRRNRAYTRQPTQVRLSPQGFGQRDGVGSLILKPWDEGYRVWLGPRGKHYRLRIYRGWLAFALANPIDLEFEGDVETVKRIREHLEWCQATGKR